MIMETERSVQETNMGSRFVTLDKKWVKYNNINKQDKIVQFSDGDISILITTNGKTIKDPEKIKEIKEILEYLTSKNKNFKKEVI